MQHVSPTSTKDSTSDSEHNAYYTKLALKYLHDIKNMFEKSNEWPSAYVLNVKGIAKEFPVSHIELTLKSVQHLYKVPTSIIFHVLYRRFLNYPHTKHSTQIHG